MLILKLLKSWQYNPIFEFVVIDSRRIFWTSIELPVTIIVGNWKDAFFSGEAERRIEQRTRSQKKQQKD